MIKHWQSLSIAAIANPHLAIGRLPLLSSEERAAIVVKAPSNTGHTYSSVIERFESRVAETPDAIAITDGVRRLTYSELNAQANGVALAIRRKLERTSAHENLIGICVRRSIEQVTAILATLKAGAAYVPLDPDAPAARLQFILEDAGVALLITDNPTADIKGPTEFVLTDRTAAALADPANLRLSTAPESAAYVIYTSGSTGEPKGTVITHGNVSRLFTSTEHWFNFGSEDVWTLFHSYAFDFSVWEIWGALLYGGRLVIVSYETSRDPEEFYRLISREEVTVLNQTPSAFYQLMQAEAGHRETLPLRLRYVIFGGEALHPSRLQTWFDRHGDEQPKLINMYGITETTVHVTYRRLIHMDTQSAVSPIGEPIHDLWLYVLDSNLEPVPDGIAGELFVGGAGLARGYLNRDVLTAERFINDPFRPGERLYRTGDRVRRNRNKGLEYFGRVDQQVKIRGYRIETEEIAAVLNRFDGISEAVVRVQMRNERPILQAYYVPSNGGVSTAALRRHLQAFLPAYMVPDTFVPLVRLPLTINGKLNERALLESGESFHEVSTVGDAIENPLIREIVSIWQSLLEHSQLSPDDNVFDHGANSVLAVQARNELQTRLAREVPVVLLFQHPTARSLALQLQPDSREDEKAEIVRHRVRRTPRRRHDSREDGNGF
jgi:amino acid adenylation domain-containing protein